MKKPVKICLITLLTLTNLLTSFFVSPKAAAFTPPYTTLKVGLFFGSTALPSANLQNVTGFGSGYQFGFLDAQRNFIPLGAQTSETKITMLRDRNMVYNAAENAYTPGADGSVVVGCFHIQLNTAYGTYAEAAAAVTGIPGSFVKYSGGSFYAMIGNYLSAEAASAAISTNGYTNCSVNSGTSNTIAVVKTGTNQMLFEFDYGTTYNLVVMPLSVDSTKCQTWFKGYRYYGGFQYSRIDSGDLTVYNIVNLDDYVKGVIPYEMNNTWPIEALKAQAVCARSYVMTSRKHTGFDVCTTECCQVYQGIGRANETTDAAVDQTSGKFLTYNDQPVIAYYSSCDGGATESSENVWKDSVPYLRGIYDPYEADVAGTVPGYSWTVTYTSDQITSRLRARGYNCGTIVSMTVAEFTPTGNVYKITLTDSNGVKWSFTKGESIRLALGISSIRFTINGADVMGTFYINSGTTSITGGLQSSYAIGGSGLTDILGQPNVYAITGSGEVKAVGDTRETTPGVFTIRGTGKGHNVGMSQWGAYSMAKFHGMAYDQILKFYFTGVHVG